METIVAAYKTLSKIPSIIGGKLNNDGSRITCKCSVRNLDKGKTTKYLLDYVLNSDMDVVSEIEFGLDVTNELLSKVSPNGTYRAVIRVEKDSKEAKKQYLEVWCRHNLAHCIDLTSLDIHGDIYADSEFGSLNWTQDETAIVYVAEKKLKKSEAYIKRKGEDKSKTDGSWESTPKKGEEFLYRQDWGEQLVGKHLSVIVVCSLDTESFTVLDGLPETWCPGQVRFANDGKSVVGVAWETEPRRLGLIFCTNRPSYIFNLTLDGTMIKMSSEGFSVRSPRVSKTGDLFWLQRLADGPHYACHALVGKRKDAAEVSTIIDIVQTEIETANGAAFHGVYSQSLPSECFASDNRVVFSTPQQNEVRTYVVDIDGGTIVDISNKSFPCSTTVLDVKSDVILASCSNMTTPARLFVARLPAKGSEAGLKWIPIAKPCGEIPESVANSTVQYMELKHDTEDPVKSFTALYFAPNAEGKKLPLIVWPHGGPHSGFINAYSLEAALFNMLGFASLQINYRGSTGTGDSSVRFLPKRVGDADVKDCKLATDEVLKVYPVDPTKLCLFGGSHGGFLVTHLSGQYPDVYKVVVSRNPVIDVASFASVRINFRGSTGQGDEVVRCLISHVGDYDIKDCLLALTSLRERDARLSDVILYGGSYGGFVAAHLAGRYPEMFKAMVLRNPLIDLATKSTYADKSWRSLARIWCAVEAGYVFTEKGPVSDEELLAMRRCSPIAHVHHVKAPTALMLGSGDKRVPHYQGLEYSRRLKANGVPTRVYMYEDNHSLSSLPAEMDNLINSADWFLTHLAPKSV